MQESVSVNYSEKATQRFSERGRTTSCLQPPGVCFRRWIFQQWRFLDKALSGIKFCNSSFHLYRKVNFFVTWVLKATIFTGKGLLISGTFIITSKLFITITANFLYFAWQKLRLPKYHFFLLHVQYWIHCRIKCQQCVLFILSTQDWLLLYQSLITTRRISFSHTILLN